MVDLKSLIAFQTMDTKTVRDFVEVPVIVKQMLNIYENSITSNNFSFRIILPRSKDSNSINNKSKKIGLQIQNEFLLGLRKLKLKSNLREFRYIHDEEHYGWILMDPSIHNKFTS